MYLGEKTHFPKRFIRINPGHKDNIESYLRDKEGDPSTRPLLIGE